MKNRLFDPLSPQAQKYFSIPVSLRESFVARSKPVMPPCYLSPRLRRRRYSEFLAYVEGTTHSLVAYPRHPFAHLRIYARAAKRFTQQESHGGRLENVHLLLTGATGVIGAATLAEIAALFPDWRVTALVRAGDANAARARLEAAVASYGIRHMPPTWRVLPGDLGSLASLPASALSGVSHVLNLAANTSHSAKRRAWEINVVQTKAMMERLLQIASIARIVHVSTAVTCGDSPAARLLREGDYPRRDDRHYTAYASSKAEAEHVLGGLAPKDRLCIAVPSIVVGHTRLGCAPSGSLYWGFRAVEALGFVTWPRQNRLDVVPSDWAARALLHLLTRPTLRHQRYHVSAGATSSINWNDLARTFACIKDPAAARSRYRIASPEAYQEAVARCRAAFGQGNVRHIATVLRHYRRFAEWNVVFSNRRLLAEGVPPPPRFTDYLELCERTSSGRSIVDQMSENAVDL